MVLGRQQAIPRNTAVFTGIFMEAGEPARPVL